MWLSDIARMLADAIPPALARCRGGEIPPAVIVALGRLIPAVAGRRNHAAGVKPVSDDKAQTVLGIRFRSAEEAAVAMGASLIAFGPV